MPMADGEFVTGEIQVMLIRKESDGENGVRVIVLQARNLPCKDLNGLSDPYVKITLGQSKRKTKVPG